MDKELVHYIITNFTELMTENERLAQKNLHLQAKLAQVGNPGESYRTGMTGMMKFNPEIKELMKDGWPAFEEGVAARLLAEHREKIYATACSRCGKFPRTAKAKQCYHCGHDWH